MILNNLTEEQYRASEELSKSDLVWLLKSPKHFQRRHELKKQSDAMNFGTAFHTLLLEPHRKNDVVVYPEFVNGEKLNKRKKDHKLFIEKFEEDNKGKIFIDSKEWDSLVGMLTACGESEDLADLMRQGEAEVSGFCEYRGFQFKGRADRFIEKHPRYGRTVVEVKTAMSAEPSEFSREIYNRAYDLGAAVYKRVFEADTVVFVVVEKTSPFMVEVRPAHFSLIDHGQKRFDFCIDKLIDMNSPNAYTGYGNQGDCYFLPAWVAGKADEV